MALQFDQPPAIIYRSVQCPVHRSILLLLLSAIYRKLSVRSLTSCFIELNTEYSSKATPLLNLFIKVHLHWTGMWPPKRLSTCWYTKAERSRLLSVITTKALLILNWISPPSVAPHSTVQRQHLRITDYLTVYHTSKSQVRVILMECMYICLY